jgi:hypothetical protein
MKKTIIAAILSTSLSVASSYAAVSFSATSLGSSISGGNPLSLTAGQTAVYLNMNSSGSWSSFASSEAIASGLSFTAGTIFTPSSTSDQFSVLGSAAVSGTTTLTVSGGAFSPLTYAGAVGVGDQFALLVFNSSTSSTAAGDTYNIWRASDWVMPADGSVLSFANTPVSGESIQRITTSAFLVGSGSVVPEPSTYALMALGGLVLFFIARRRKAQV